MLMVHKCMNQSSVSSVRLTRFIIQAHEGKTFCGGGNGMVQGLTIALDYRELAI